MELENKNNQTASTPERAVKKKNKGRNTTPPSPDFEIRFNRPLHGEWPLSTSNNGHTPSDRLPVGPWREYRICR